MKIGIFTDGTSVRSKNIFTAISRYPTGKHEIMLVYLTGWTQTKGLQGPCQKGARVQTGTNRVRYRSHLPLPWQK